MHGPLLCGPPLLDHSSVALHLGKRLSTFEPALLCCLPSDCPDFKKKKKGLHLWESDFCPYLRKKVFSSERAIFALISQKKVFPSGRAIFSLISKKRRVHRSPRFLSIRYNSNKTFLNQATNFSDSSAAHAKSPMAHQWALAHCLRNPALNKSGGGYILQILEVRCAMNSLFLSSLLDSLM